MSNAPDRQMFWTTVPGILTGVAALITAVATAIAVLASNTDDRPTPVAATPSVASVPTTAGSPGPAVAPVDDPVGPVASSAAAGTARPGRPVAAAPEGEYLLYDGGKIDVDSGTFGSGVVDEELYWGNYVRIYGERHVRVDQLMDGPGCARALERGMDDEAYHPDDVEEGLIICLRSDQGRLALVVVSPPTTEDRLPVGVTSFGP